MQHSFATGANQKDFARLALEQLSRSELHRCPLGQASNEVVEALLEQWEVSDYATSTTLTPLLLSFARVHALALRFFVRMWADSSALASSPTDFTRVGAIVRSQVREVLKDEQSLVKGGLDKAWKTVEDGFLRSEYRTIKQRMVKEAEESDDVTKKLPIRCVLPSTPPRRLFHASLTPPFAPPQESAQHDLRGVPRICPPPAYQLHARGRLVQARHARLGPVEEHAAQRAARVDVCPAGASLSVACCFACRRESLD